MAFIAKPLLQTSQFRALSGATIPRKKLDTLAGCPLYGSSHQLDGVGSGQLGVFVQGNVAPIVRANRPVGHLPEEVCVGRFDRSCVMQVNLYHGVRSGANRSGDPHREARFGRDVDAGTLRSAKHRLQLLCGWSCRAGRSRAYRTALRNPTARECEGSARSYTLARAAQVSCHESACASSMRVPHE